MSTRIRYRTDNDRLAEAKALGHAFEREHPGCDCGREDCPLMPSPANRARWDATPAAEPGDTWRYTWGRTIDDTGPDRIAGYGICCPTCRQVHRWTTALNCGVRGAGQYCEHNGVGSCWSWSGSAEEGTLSASPSLYAVRACGWHGFLTNGELRSC